MDDRRLDRRLAIFIATLGLALFVNNAFPYLGLRDDSCQAMFSGLEWAASTNNHVFVPQYALSDRWAYHTEVSAELTPVAEPFTRAAYLERWLNQSERRLNTEATRAVVRQVCDAGHTVRMSYRDPEGRRHEGVDACGDDTLSSPAWWIPVRLYETDIPAP